MKQSDYHSFYIPVMGTGFTIDTPLKVARYGISSSISLVDDVLIEKMRKHHALKAGLPYLPITERDYDARASRITSYLNLVKYLVEKQVDALRSEPFTESADISRYFQFLPSQSPLKAMYREMLETGSAQKKTRLQESLRDAIVPGRIDVNIMTKVDAVRKRNLNSTLEHPSDAQAALRGFASSDLHSSVIFSAGLNPRLYQYVSKFADFLPLSDGSFIKKIIVKVSDFRSALIQGKYFAKLGLWVSEFRVESGLNCGGHAFASSGHLMGPILREFVDKRQELKANMDKLWRRTLGKKQNMESVPTPDLHICAQGGVGTASEHEYLMNHFDLDEIGWGTPFMLVPEATLVDESHLQKLIDAQPRDIVLSGASPLGIPFWKLSGTASEEHQKSLIQSEKPGSLCPKQYAITNTEFSKHPICTASREYQKKKIDELNHQSVSPEKKKSIMNKILEKACICHDLAGAATLKLNLVKQAFPAICCGPNMAFFDQISSLKNMIDHIYGRISLLKKTRRPNMFINELRINFDWVSKEFDAYKKDLSDKSLAYFNTFKDNLTQGIEEYRKMAEEMLEDQRASFLRELREMEMNLELLFRNLQEITA